MQLIYLPVFFLFFLDRITKHYFVFTGNNFKVWAGMLNFDLHYNNGIAFSLPMFGILYYFLFTIVFLSLIYFFINFYKKRDKTSVFFILLVITGALSNLFDRLRYGAVVDFIDVPWWAVFNLADCYIAVGAILWIIKIFFDGKKISKKS